MFQLMKYSDKLISIVSKFLPIVVFGFQKILEKSLSRRFILEPLVVVTAVFRAIKYAAGKTAIHFNF